MASRNIMSFTGKIIVTFLEDMVWAMGIKKSNL